MDHRTTPIRQYSWGSRKQSLTLVLLFCAALGLPLAGWLFDWQGPTLAENRNLAARPDFRHTRIKDLPAKIDAYYDDHVGFRRAAIRLSGVVFHRVLGESSGDVVIGKFLAPGQPRWYFYASEGILEDRLGMGLFAPAQLAAWRNMLIARSAWLHSQGIAYLFVVVPEKSSIYPELLPDYVQDHAGRTRLDQLARYLKDTYSGATFVDLRPALHQAKTQGLVYFPFDTHWNGHGVFHGYTAIIGAFQRVFPNLVAGRMGRDFEIRPGPGSFRTDLASMLGLNEPSAPPLLAYAGPATPKFAPAKWPAGFDPSLYPDHGLYALEIPGQRGRLLMFHDSAFVAPLFSFESQPLAAHFARSTFVWLSPSDAGLRRFVEIEHPDVVVEEHAERVLRFVPPPSAHLESTDPRARKRR